MVIAVGRRGGGGRNDSKFKSEDERFGSVFFGGRSQCTLRNILFGKNDLSLDRRMADSIDVSGKQGVLENSTIVIDLADFSCVTGGELSLDIEKSCPTKPFSLLQHRYESCHVTACYMYRCTYTFI